MMPDVFEGVEWDQRKDLSTRELRGLSFEFAARVFLGDYLEEKSGRQGVSEVRFMAIGPVEDTIVSIVWTPRGRVRRIISVRYASRKERRRYDGYRSQEAQ